MIELKLAVMLACGALFAWGGYSYHNARRFIMPMLLTATALLVTHDAWALLMLISIGPLCLGYGEKSPLRHIFGNGWGRGVWGLLVASCLSLPLFLSTHLGWLPFVLYLSLGFTLENVLKNIPQLIGDLIIGFSFGSIVLFVVPHLP